MSQVSYLKLNSYIIIILIASEWHRVHVWEWEYEKSSTGQLLLEQCRPPIMPFKSHTWKHCPRWHKNEATRCEYPTPSVHSWRHKYKYPCTQSTNEEDTYRVHLFSVHKLKAQFLVVPIPSVHRMSSHNLTVPTFLMKVLGWMCNSNKTTNSLTFHC